MGVGVRVWSWPLRWREGDYPLYNYTLIHSYSNYRSCPHYIHTVALLAAALTLSCPRSRLRTTSNVGTIDRGFRCPLFRCVPVLFRCVPL